MLEEWRLGLGADARILQKQLPVLLKGSRYADRLPIGTPDSIRTFAPGAPEAVLSRTGTGPT